MSPQVPPVNPRFTAEDQVIPTMACPRCGEHKCRPSMRTGPLEYVLALFSIKPYRCRGCRKRFYRQGAPPAEMEILGANELDPEEEITPQQAHKSR